MPQLADHIVSFPFLISNGHVPGTLRASKGCLNRGGWARARGEGGGGYRVQGNTRIIYCTRGPHIDSTCLCVGVVFFQSGQSVVRLYRSGMARFNAIF